MSEGAGLTVEILTQVRDGVFEVKTEVTVVRDQVDYLHQEQIKTNARLDTMREALGGEIAALRRTVVRGAKINDNPLTTSLEDAGRMDALEGRVRTQAQVAELRER